MIFSHNPDIYKNAFPNWQKKRTNYDEYFVLYSKQFKNSADKLIDSIGENCGHVADTIINPSLYLYRHSIELCLKAILYKCYTKSNKSTDKIIEKLLSHNLETLWSKVTEQLTKNYDFIKDQNDKNQLKKIGKLVIELHNSDDNSMTFRYPYDTKLDEFVYGNGEESFSIDFLHIKGEIDYLYSRLYYWIYECISYSEDE